MPESCVHDEAVELLKAVLAWWASRRGNTHVARNLAVRWDGDEPRVGVDPDVSAFSPPPPREKGSDLRSVRTWLPGHSPPLLAVEVVSTTNPNEDYTIAPDKYAASGTRELWIFDPLLAGPASHGGPFRLQLWQRNERGAFVRAYAGEGPFFSDVAGAYVIADPRGARARRERSRAGPRRGARRQAPLARRVTVPSWLDARGGASTARAYSSAWLHRAVRLLR